MREKQKENNKGITLIALVISIIVIMLLAGVSVAMLADNNSIFEKANKAKAATKNARVQEDVLLAYDNAVANTYVDASAVVEDDMKEDLEKIYGEGVSITEDDGIYTVTINGVDYTVGIKNE